MDGQTDRRRTKWSLCATMLRRRHNEMYFCMPYNIVWQYIWQWHTLKVCMLEDLMTINIKIYKQFRHCILPKPKIVLYPVYLAKEDKWSTSTHVGWNFFPRQYWILNITTNAIHSHALAFVFDWLKSYPYRELWFRLVPINANLNGHFATAV